MITDYARGRHDVAHGPYPMEQCRNPECRAAADARREDSRDAVSGDR